MIKTLIIGKNSFFGSKFKNIKNSKIISHRHVNKTNFDDYNKIILLSMPKNYNKKLSSLNFEKNIFSKCKNKRLIYFSSSLVYPNKLNNKENSAKPQNIYARNKIKIEKEIQKNFKNYLILRVPIVFMKKKYSKNNFFYIMNKNFKLNKIKFNISMNSIRDLVTLDDLYIYYIKIDKLNLKGVYNVGSGKGLSVKKILELYYDKKMNNPKIKFYFKKRTSNLTLNVNRLESKIGKISNKIYINVINELKK